MKQIIALVASCGLLLANIANAESIPLEKVKEKAQTCAACQTGSMAMPLLTRRRSTRAWPVSITITLRARCTNEQIRRSGRIRSWPVSPRP